MSKGKSFEREISKDMSLWLTRGTDQDCIWYTKSSGGRATRRAKASEQVSKYDHGDLGPDGPKLNWFFDAFSIELKTGYGKKTKSQVTLWSIMDIIDSQQQNPIIYEFWMQAVNDATLSSREPMLIFRRNRRSPCIAMQEPIFKTFIEHKPIEFDTVKIQFVDEPYPIVACNIRYFYDHTWGIVNESFIKYKINRTRIRIK